MDPYLLNLDAFASPDADMKVLHAPLMKFLRSLDASASANSIGVCGSYMTRTLIRVAPDVEDVLPAADMCITMPSCVCSEADANDGSYKAKRDAFCADIAAYLSKEVEGVTATVGTCLSRADKTVVSVSFGAGKIPINIHPRVEGISDYLVKGMKKRGRYVSSILEDAAMPAVLKLVHGVCAPRPNYVRAIIVLKAWANHCGISPAHNSPYNHSEQFQPFIFAVLLTLLHEGGIVSATMSEENILRTVWVQLARGFIDGPKLMVPEAGFPLLNVLHRTSQRFIDTIVKPAAEEALKLSAAVEVFNGPRIPFPMLFSAVLKVTVSDAAEMAKVYDLVAYALQDRLSHAFVQPDADGTSALVFARIRTADGRNKLTKGPSLEQTADVEKFTSFWGAAAVSTRQFADGSIHKCVSWAEDCFAYARTAFAGHANPADVMLSVSDITTVIVLGTLKRHLASFGSLSNVFSGVSDVLCERIGDTYVDTAPIANRNLQIACDEMTKVVGSVNSALACRVVGFDIISATARECEPYPIRPHAALTAADTTAPLLSVTPSIEPVYCVLTIDDKNKIPDNLDAIKTMKGALCAQLSNALTQANYESYCTTISVDVISNSGYVFRIFIAHFREVSLLRALERAPQADMIERKLFWSTQHHKYVHSVLTNVHVTYSKAVRLAKRWVGAMLLADFITPEAIELLVGYSYLVPANKPRSAEEGFYRFLRLVAYYNWSIPLVLDPTIVVDHKKVWDTEATGMIILATYDATQCSPFTAHTPRPMIVHRLSALAAGALRAFEEGRLASLWLCDIPSSFDVALPLSPAMALASDRCIARPPTAPNQFRLWRAGDLTGADRQRYVTQLCELEPANFCLRTLRAATRDKCMIFMDSYGPQTLAVVSLAQKPNPQQIRSLVVALVEAAPKGSLGHIEIPPVEAPKPKAKKEGGAGQKKGRREEKNEEEAKAAPSEEDVKKDAPAKKHRPEQKQQESSKKGADAKQQKKNSDKKQVSKK